jgi:ornithine decarboxylase
VVEERAGSPAGVARFHSVDALVEHQRPNGPVFCIRPRAIVESVERFRRAFPGRVLYAIKCNPHPLVLGAVYEGGIRDFDAASLPEIAGIARTFSDARSHFMHPVKDRESIRQAYGRFGVRHFVVDCAAELEKLLDEVPAHELFVFVRIETPRTGDVLYHLSAKFGATPDAAACLLAEAGRRGCGVGLTFHVGSQCLEPKAYRVALERVGLVIDAARLVPAVIDVGGGFPQAYPDLEVPPLDDFVAEIETGVRELGLSTPPELWAEPGRALVAPSCSVLTRVVLRHGERVYLNDGVYGSFSELIDSEEVLPTRVRSGSDATLAREQEFSVYGPTCDSMDVFASKLWLPANLSEGDWVEIGQIGAYSNTLATRFNGFGIDAFAEVADEPLTWDREDADSS